MTERPLSPEEKMMHSYLIGKGIYSGLQLKNTLLAPSAPEEEEKFVIKIPKEKLQHVKKSSVEEHLLNIGQAIKGFNDKGKEHYNYNKNQLHKELEKAQERYVQALTQSKKASLEKESTPHVDALCLGMLAEIEKQAEETISDGALKRSLKNLASPVTKHLPSLQKTKENFIEKPLMVSTLATLLLKSNLNKEENKQTKPPMNIQVEAI